MPGSDRTSKNHYQLLGVDPDASADEIKKEYKKLNCLGSLLAGFVLANSSSVVLSGARFTVFQQLKDWF